MFIYLGWWRLPYMAVLLVTALCLALWVRAGLGHRDITSARFGKDRGLVRTHWVGPNVWVIRWRSGAPVSECLFELRLAPHMIWGHTLHTLRLTRDCPLTRFFTLLLPSFFFFFSLNHVLGRPSFSLSECTLFFSNLFHTCSCDVYLLDILTKGKKALSLGLKNKQTSSWNVSK